MKETKLQRLTTLVVQYINTFGKGKPHFNDDAYLSDLGVRKPLPVCAYDDDCPMHQPPEIYLTASGDIFITTDASGPTGEYCIKVTPQEMRRCIQAGKPYPW